VKLAGIQRVLPPCDNDPAADALSLPGPGGQATSVYRCRVRQPDGSEPVVAVAVERDSSTNSNKPYSGLIQLLVGVDVKTGRVRSFERKGKPEVGVVILKHSETPGLGSKAASYAFRSPFADRNLVGEDESEDPQHPGQRQRWVTRKDDPVQGFVDAISGATITSRAVTEIVKGALEVTKSHHEEILSQPPPPADEPKER
jgi:Na+-translocating ferredoxin:NAD+ oxidoreductase RnfG subunit